MLSNNVKILGLMMVLLGCSEGGSPETAQSQKIIGEPIAVASHIYSDGALRSDVVFKYDEFSNEILQFDFSSEEVISRIGGLQKSENHGVIGDVDGQYAIDLSTQHLSVHAIDGYVEKNPFLFQGKPVSAAYDPTSRHLVVYDDLASVGMLKLAANGRVVSKALLGPVLGESNAIEAGDIDSEGQLLLSLTDHSLVVADMDSTIAATAWQFASFKIEGVEDIDWIAPVRGYPGKLIATSLTEVLLIDYEGEVVLARTPRPQDAFRSKQTVAHISGLVENERFIIFSSDGATLTSKRIPDVDGIPSNFQLRIYNSYLNIDDLSVSFVLGSAAEVRQFIRVRISDNLVLRYKELPNKSEVFLGGDAYMVSYESPLGKVERWSTSTDQVDGIEGYNLGHFQGR